MPKQLPDLPLRIDATKIIDYLLSGTNSRGKADFFLRFGFTVDHWETLSEALKIHARNGSVATFTESPFGTRYSVDGILNTPDGRTPLVRTVWIAESEMPYLRLITAHPA
jgi:hypothetical protein